MMITIIKLSFMTMVMNDAVVVVVGVVDDDNVDVDEVVDDDVEMMWRM